MHLVTVGVNHNTAPVEVREKLAIPESRIEEGMNYLNNLSDIQESVFLSTCNRIEIYARVAHPDTAIESIKRFYSEFNNIRPDLLENSFYQYHTVDTIKHLFAVSSSLDSMVMGEPQILGQVKTAYLKAKNANKTGSLINQLFEKAFFVAKKVKNETGIAENAVSISFAAVELARKIFGDLEGKSVMLIGAGEMSELAAKHLISYGIKTILVSNRTFERAVELANQLNGNAIRFDNFTDELERTDIIISSTGAPHFIIKKDVVEKVIHKRKNRPMFFIDIAVPRDIEPEVNEIDNVYLYNIDDLQNVIEVNKKEREKEAEKAYVIIEKEVNSFIHWLDSLDIVPTIRDIKNKAEEVRLQEMEKTFSKWDNLSDNERKAVDVLTQSIVNKIINTPIINLKKEYEGEQGHWFLKVSRKLFNLD
ncbi:MAG: glutamyl-tRNA reductase [Nitrospinae bacterium]|nr:glutamyl-tRNA reductase [Nitrospinota bacterium]